MNKAKSEELLDAIEINPAEPAAASLIWLHGLGASGDDFVPIAAELQTLAELPLRFVFPHAPERPVTINLGYVMPAWYDITSLEKDADIDQEGILLSVEQVKALIQAEKERGFSSQQILLAGFSQGAVIALHTLLTAEENFAGVIALSGYLPPRKLCLLEHTTPIFIGHGLSDEMIPCIYGQAAAEALKKAGYPVTWKTYHMTHSVCDQEVRDLAGWLKTVLKAN